MLIKSKISVFKRPIMFLLGVVTVISACIGINASWIKVEYINSNFNSSIVANPKDAVAYIVNDNIYFSTIEGAVEYANNLSGNKEVKVLLKDNDAKTIRTITRSFTVGSNVTLTIPYTNADDSNFLYKIINKDDLNNNSTATLDSTHSGTKSNSYLSNINTTRITDSNSSNAKLLVQVEPGITITNNGKLLIGGVHDGGGGGNISGIINLSYYSQLSLIGDSQLINSGTIVCLGYIAGVPENEKEPNMVNNSNSKLYMPFVVVEHRGGSNFQDLYKNGNWRPSKWKFYDTPFNRFYLPSLFNLKTQFLNSSFVYGIADLYASSHPNRTLVNLFGNSSSYLINNSNSSFVLDSYFSYNSNSNGIPLHGLFFSGSCSINSLSLSLKILLTNITISTESLYFPVSCYYDVTIKSNSSISSSSQNIKLLPGTSLSIESNATLTLPSLAVYNGGHGDIKGVAGVISYEKHTTAANLTVYGALNINGSLGGLVKKTNTASVSYSSTTTTTYEVKNDDASWRTITLSYSSQTI